MNIIILILILCLIWILFNYLRNRLEHVDNVGELNPDNLYKHLSYVTDQFDRFNIRYWLIYGTLLGAIRDGDIIEYDYDFDVGAFVDDAQKIKDLNEHIKKDGYEFVEARSNLFKMDGSGQQWGWRVSYKVKYNDVEVGDIYLYKRCRDGYMRRYDPNQGIYYWPKSTFPAWFVDKMTKVKLRDKMFTAPRDPTILLRHWYGKTWMTPIKAKAQGGKGDANSDYYGGDMDLKLSFLTNYLYQKYGIGLEPVMNHRINFYYPGYQRDWIFKNEHLF